MSIERSGGWYIEARRLLPLRTLCGTGGMLVPEGKCTPCISVFANCCRPLANTFSPAFLINTAKTFHHVFLHRNHILSLRERFRLAESHFDSTSALRRGPGPAGKIASGSGFAVSYSSALMILRRPAARTEPHRGPTQYIHCSESKLARATDGAKERAGFNEPPVQKTPVGEGRLVFGSQLLL